jgi:dethiobiotin synthetase
VRGCFVTGTDTGVGKTVVAAALVAALRGRGVAVRALKPVLTGLGDPPDANGAHDHELLARAAGSLPEDVALVRYDPPVSPHLAGELGGRAVDVARLLELIREAGAACDLLVVEGVGGLRVPLTSSGYSVRELARDVGLPLVIAARPGLGTINHTLLTVESARSAALTVAGVVLTPWPEDAGVIERSNRETIERLADVPVAALPFVPAADPELLAAAGERLPLDAWLGVHSDVSAEARV